MTTAPCRGTPCSGPTGPASWTTGASSPAHADAAALDPGTRCDAECLIWAVLVATSSDTSTRTGRAAPPHCAGAGNEWDAARRIAACIEPQCLRGRRTMDDLLRGMGERRRAARAAGDGRPGAQPAPDAHQHQDGWWVGDLFRVRGAALQLGSAPDGVGMVAERFWAACRGGGGTRDVLVATSAGGAFAVCVRDNSGQAAVRAAVVGRGVADVAFVAPPTAQALARTLEDLGTGALTYALRLR